MTSREQPAANFGVLYFFITDLTSRSWTLFDGRISATAPIEPGQLIGGVKHLLHLVLRCKSRQRPNVADNPVDQPGVVIQPAEDFLHFDAVRLRPALEIEVVQQPDQPPEILLIPVSQFIGKPPHHPFNGDRVAAVERFFVILAEQFPGFFPGRHFGHR